MRTPGNGTGQTADLFEITSRDQASDYEQEEGEWWSGDGLLEEDSICNVSVF